MADNEVRFGELSPDGYRETGSLKKSTIAGCQHFIIALEHYRDDGSCKCDDKNETLMHEWGYEWDEKLGRWN